MAAIRRRIKLAIYTLFKLIGGFAICRRLMRRRLTILGYHGFQYDDEAAWRPILFMDPQRFARRLDYLAKQNYPVISLDRGVQGLAEGGLPDNAVVITIDDGFYSVLDLAAPIIRQHGYAATLYVTSYYVTKETAIFRLVVQYMFWKTDREHFDVPGHPWSPPYAVSLDAPEVTHQTMWHIIDYGEAHCSEDERQRICAIVANALGLDYADIASSRRLSLLTCNELQQLEEFNIDVQLHTHRHEFPYEKPEAARQELADNRTVLDQTLGRRLSHFCYPSGVWSRDALPILDTDGIQSATTCEPGLNDATTHPLALYRFLDQDNLADIEFEAELTGFNEFMRIVTGRRRRTDRLHYRDTP